MTLDELIQKCKQHDVSAQGELYKQYSSVMFSICLRYSPNYTEAEDNLQDAFMTIFDKIGQFKGKGSFEGWMKRVTVNTVLQKYRRQKVYAIKEEANLEQPDDEDVVIESEVPLAFLLKIIQELPDRYRLVFSMYVLDGYQHKEIAEMLGISDGTSKSNLARARGILKTKIEAYRTTEE
ncbi:sigma-70 family RNA polymerase sigma factor [Rasiella rasia]|uniref:Sigma-70 family RNA polymerase sigma factor n=1 Tax=Rasiella rasia TaxID=2744027 RepID=A0A6G6GN92_9FLAO|nr:sigma-70 family RNA polymerase sigma factor [Rasiella rasia]QIE59960.1 sigma-70 family RNA polymerase sigma factor [Rasiella rasia]